MKTLLDEVNARLEPHEQLEFLAMVSEPWTMENGYLTPTMKIRRSAIEKRYDPRVPQWFDQRSEVVWE